MSEQREKEQKVAARRLRRRAIAAAGAAAAAGILLLLSIVTWRKGEAARAAAEEARNRGDELIKFMLFDLRKKLEPIGRVDVLNDVAQEAKAYFEKLPKNAITDSRLRQLSVVLSNLGEIRVAQGDL